MFQQNFPINIENVNVLNDKNIKQFNELREPGTEWDETEGKKFLKNTDNALFLAFTKDNVVGFLTAHRLQRLDKRKAEILIYEIDVSSNFRQMGIGKALLTKVKEWAGHVEADEVWVLTNRSNEAGMALYKSSGGTTESADEQMFTFKI